MLSHFEILPVEHPHSIRQARLLLELDQLVAFPTDTVYGLAARIDSARGIDRLFSAKGRENTKAIAVLLGSVDQVDRVASGWDPRAHRLADHFWPGALTLIVPKRAGLPEDLSPYPTVGIRIPDHEFTIRLLKECGPLATTSANLSGQANALTAVDVLNQLGTRIEMILDGGPVSGGIPSTVVDCTTPEIKILRQGAIPADQIFAVAGQV
jgi:L-threonylcarbamoyladenylate synthase